MANSDMDSTSFEFTLSVPCDERLLGAVRDLTSHAASYARLEDAAVDGLTSQVAAAARAAIEACAAPDAAVDFRFKRHGATLTVSIGLDVASAARWPASATAGLTVDTTRDGARETCLITQHLA